MNARERQAVKIWAAVALMSAAAMSLYGPLTLLMLFGIPIPLVLFINFMPTVFLYLTPALILISVRAVRCAGGACPGGPSRSRQRQWCWPRDSPSHSGAIGRSSGEWRR